MKKSISNWFSVTGEYRHYIDTDLLTNINSHDPIRSENSLGFKYPVYGRRKAPVFIKIYKVKPGFHLLDENTLRDLCCINHKNVNRHLDIALIPEKSELFPGSVITINEFIQPESLPAVILYLHNHRNKLNSFIVQLLRGFHELHSKNLLHRDVNIFNLLFKFSRGNILPVINDLTIFRPVNNSSLFCSPEFLAPEVSSYLEYDRHSEIWAIGILVYFFLTFNFPFDSRLLGKKSDEVIDAVKNGHIDLMNELLFEPYEEIITSMLNLVPSERPTDLSGLADFLQKKRPKTEFAKNLFHEIPID